MKDKDKQAILAHWPVDGGHLRRDKSGGYRLTGQGVAYQLIKGEKQDPYFENILILRRCLEKNNFLLMPKLVAAADGTDYLIRQNAIYALAEVKDGDRFSFSKGKQVVAAASTLAQFHQAANSCNDEPHGFDTRHRRDYCRDFEALLLTAEEAFSTLLAEDDDVRLTALLADQGEALLARSERGLISLCASPYRRLIEEVEAKGGVVFGVDKGEHLLYGGDEVWLYDFSGVSEDLAISDLYHLLRRLPSRGEETVRTAEEALVSYDAIRPLREEEWLVLRPLLLFGYYPLRLLCRLAKARRQRSGKEDIIAAKLRDALAQEGGKKEFYRWLNKRRRD